MSTLQYALHFIVYTLAMTGVLVVGYVVCKKVNSVTPNGAKNSHLKIKDALKLPDRKILYVIECAGENFLIASSSDKVTLISKLEEFKKAEDKKEIERYLKEKKQLEAKLSGETIYGAEEFEADEGGQEGQRKVIKSLLKELSDKNQTKRNY